MLIIAEHQTRFSCLVHEDVDGGLRADRTPLYGLTSLPRSLVSRAASEDSSAHLVKWQEEWIKLATYYTSRRHSVPRDRLLAIGGLANRFNELFQSDFVAGLWRRHLPMALCWRVLPRKFMTKECDSHRQPYFVAPSWSWASVTGSIRFLSLIHI